MPKPRIGEMNRRKMKEMEEREEREERKDLKVRRRGRQTHSRARSLAISYFSLLIFPMITKPSSIRCVSACVIVSSWLTLWMWSISFVRMIGQRCTTVS